MHKGQSKGRLLLWSSTGFLLATGLTPAVSLAQQNDPNASTQIAQAQQAAPPAAQPGNAKNPAAPQIAVANLKRDDIVGNYLYDKNGDSVAKIQDVKTSPDGKIQAVGIDVGGFLGIGASRINVPADDLQRKGDRIEATSLTADQIRNLPREAK